ncbi:MAG TPA: HEAT repeat domain-containing protein [Planctomycetaceae bacterium]|jgi:HEAT repeat protein|nr:HEAT repeat domain-containing protein [Planctomycetaceae bacterium]
MVGRRDEKRDQEAVDYYLRKARSGDFDSAFFGLIECDHAVLPTLEVAYRSESDWAVRELLVEVIWQHRQQSLVPFLFEALQDPNEAVWMQALDGLVALASRAAKEGLEKAMSTEEQAKRREWMKEALDQIEQAITKD